MKKNKNIIWIMVGYFLITAVIMLCHEMYRDEAQSYLIIKECNFMQMINQLKYEGHLALWYIILFPFIKLGFGYEIEKIISFILVNIAAWIILNKSPFNTISKILILLSLPMIYIYQAIGRCYALIPLATCFIALLYNKRHEKPLLYVLSLCFMANIHVITLALPGMLFLVYIYEVILDRKKYDKTQMKRIIFAIIFAICIMIISYMPIFTTLSVNKSHNQEIIIKPYDILLMLKNYLTSLAYAIMLNNILGVAIILITTIILFIYEFKYYKKSLLVISLSILYILIIDYYIYPMTIYRILYIFVIYFLFAWIQKNKESNEEIVNEKQKNEMKVVKTTLYTLAILLAFVGVYGAIYEIELKFSTSYETAKYIEENLDENTLIICNDVIICSAIRPHLDEKYKLYNPHIDDKYSFVVWDENIDTMLEYDEIIELANEKKEEYSSIVYIYCINDEEFNNIDIDELINNNEIQILFESGISMFRESYIIYKINC